MSGLLWRCVSACAVFVALVALRIDGYHPALPDPLALDLELEPGKAGRADPLIVAGRINTGDFLSVRFVDPNTIQFAYDSWGHPAILSKPIAVRAGQTLKLQVEMPALTQIQGSLASSDSRVRITCDGAPVLDVDAHYYVREPDRLFFGENSLGGTACGKVLHGRIKNQAGHNIHGSVTDLHSWPQRLSDWFTRFPREVIALLVFSAAIGYASGRTRELIVLAGATRRIVFQHRQFVGAAGIATVCFAWLVTLGTFDFHYSEVFGSFYDYQALSLSHGRLDVPEDAIGGEAFETRDKLYGYFGPTPALLRMPFALSGFAFGKLSRMFMVWYFVAALLASYLILRDALAMIRRQPIGAPMEPPSLFAVLVLVGSVGLGSTIFFLGSRGFIFHEAILAGITFALWSCWCALRHLRQPHARWWIGSLVCGILSLHCRPPTGLYALTLLGCVSLIALVREWRAGRSARVMRSHVGIGLFCIGGVLSLNGLAWLKFRTFDAAPLRLSRPYTFEPARLERIDGKSFHLANLPFNFDTYILRPNFRIERGFPWIYLDAKKPRRPFPKAKIDLPDFTLAIPYAMPSLFVLATFGCIGAIIALPATRVAVGLLWVAVFPMTFALLAAIATAQRYTGDFCPFLISAAAFGLATLETTSNLWRTLLRGGIALATLAAIAVTVALTLHYQGETLWGVPESTRQRYQELRRGLDEFFRFNVAPPSAVPASQANTNR